MVSERMKNRLTILCVCVLLWSVGAASGQNHVAPVAGGNVDWTNAIIDASGVGRGPSKPVNTAQERAVAEKKAITAAHQSLMRIILGLRIDGKSRVGDTYGSEEKLLARLPGLVDEVQVVDLRYREDGSVRAMVSWRWGGPPAEFLLPDTIRLIETVQQPNAPEQNDRDSPTGIVLDARGLKAEAALVPRIVDEDGSEVYSPAYVSREHAVRIGVAGYTRDLETATKSPRSGDRPLVLKTIRTADSGPCNLVISNDDARLVHGDPRNLALLMQCRVTIVLD